MASQSANPFFSSFEYDFSKFMDLDKMIEPFKATGLNGEAFMDTQRKNLEAFSNANRLAIAGVQALAQRQAEILRSAIDEARTGAEQLASAGSPEDRMAKQAEFAKHAYETAVANMRELTDLTTKANNEAIELLSSRFVESLDEVSTAIRKGAKGNGKSK